MYQKFTNGHIIEHFGSLYYVDDIYQVSDSILKKYDLYYRNRVRLIKLGGENGPEIHDFGIPEHCIKEVA